MEAAEEADFSAHVEFYLAVRNLEKSGLQLNFQNVVSYKVTKRNGGGKVAELHSLKEFSAFAKGVAHNAKKEA